MLNLMSKYIQITDLNAQTAVAKDKFSVNPLQTYLDKYEVIYLQDLLGCELFEEFATDFAITGTEPTDPKFTAIWDAICKDYCGLIRRSEGMKSMLALFIYFEFLRDQKTKNNISGPQENVQANSTTADFIATNIYTNYNEALLSYCTIQWYITSNPDNYDYSLYNGQLKKITGII